MVIIIKYSITLIIQNIKSGVFIPIVLFCGFDLVTELAQRLNVLRTINLLLGPPLSLGIRSPNNMITDQCGSLPTVSTYRIQNSIKSRIRSWIIIAPITTPLLVKRIRAICPSQATIFAEMHLVMSATVFSNTSVDGQWLIAARSPAGQRLVNLLFDLSG